ncbi:MAG: hypothetical protein FWD68_08180 [Alphaproteobacteria bacterium]|nr:hypothetical protein [Alphaproteobacteria bacterium]
MTSQNPETIDGKTIQSLVAGRAIRSATVLGRLAAGQSCGATVRWNVL